KRGRGGHQQNPNRTNSAAGAHLSDRVHRPCAADRLQRSLENGTDRSAQAESIYTIGSGGKPIPRCCCHLLRGSRSAYNRSSTRDQGVPLRAEKQQPQKLAILPFQPLSICGGYLVLQDTTTS